MQEVHSDDIIMFVYYYTDNVVFFSDPLPPPSKVRLSLLLAYPAGWLKFTWNAVTSCCTSTYYRVVATNCGICPVTTVHTTLFCTRAPTDGSVCTFAIQTVVCENVAGNISDTITALLKGIQYYKSMDNLTP